MHSSVGIVDQDIQPAILFMFDPFKQVFNVCIFSRITDDWQTVATSLFNLRTETQLLETHLLYHKVMYNVF